MKKLFLFVLCLMAIQFFAMAQPGGMGFQRQTPEERVAIIHNKLDSAFKLEPSKLSVLDTALTVLYRAQDKKLQEFFSSGSMPDRETMMAERKKYADARDEMIQAVLSEEQFIIWKEKIEPSMRPQGRMGDGRTRQ